MVGTEFRTSVDVVELITAWYEKDISQESLIEAILKNEITVGYQPLDTNGNPDGPRVTGSWDSLVDFSSRGVIPLELLERVRAEGNFRQLNPALKDQKDQSVFEPVQHFSIFERFSLRTRLKRKLANMTFRDLFTLSFWGGGTRILNVLGFTVASTLAVGCVILVLFVLLVLPEGI